MFINHDPFLIIISSPSGAGKSTLCKMIIQNDPLINLSISATTRHQRSHEIDGKDYFFVDDEKFKEMKDKNKFLEHAKVFENYYGTPQFMVEETLDKGRCVLFDIDWQGARQIRDAYDNTSIISIFILPPSLEELERRLKSRDSDSFEVVQNRMEKALEEISHFSEYDYILVNDDLNNTYQKIRAIIETKRVERQNKSDIARLVNQFS
jgi:guanylate kinase